MASNRSSTAATLARVEQKIDGLGETLAQVVNDARAQRDAHQALEVKVGVLETRVGTLEASGAKRWQLYVAMAAPLLVAVLLAFLGLRK